MRLEDFSYDLPRELIAQQPLEPRDASRLLVLNHADGSIAHRRFREIGEYLRPGDLLVANASRVLPARLHGTRLGSGGKVEVLLLAVRGDLGPDTWEALVRPGRRLAEGARLVFGEGALTGEVLARTAAGGRVLRFHAAEGQVTEALRRVGTVPLPPYITAPLADAERYQTVYARTPGSAAAPTAGLHFTPALLEDLRARGIPTVFVTLHIGLDTFRPIESSDLDGHTMHSEEITLEAETAARINATRAAGGRIVAVGTTAVRVLESVAAEVAADPERAPGEVVRPWQGRTRLFIQPGHTFRAVDALITNFHLPRSTLLVMISAFAGRERVLHAYAAAVAKRYRFYSFGDAMLLL